LGLVLAAVGCIALRSLGGKFHRLPEPDLLFP
jgi:hypothetical protein